MAQRRVAILIDGGFFLKRLPHLVGEARCSTPQDVADQMKRMCRNHILDLTGERNTQSSCERSLQLPWIRHVYRVFYYDAIPFDGSSHHPLLNRPIDFSQSNLAKFRHDLFSALKKQRKVALRLGKVTREGDWTLPNDRIKKLLATQAWFKSLDFTNPDSIQAMTPEQLAEASRLQKLWLSIQPNEVTLPLRQKGVDMRIGIDITSITLKKQADTIILVSGDSDFVPAAKLARREGMEIILDPLWQKVNDDLFEHIDGLHSGLPKPKAEESDSEEGTESTVERA